MNPHEPETRGVCVHCLHRIVVDEQSFDLFAEFWQVMAAFAKDRFAACIRDIFEFKKQ